MAPKHALLTAARLSGLSSLARAATGSQLRILCYHGAWVTPGPSFGNCLFMGPTQFEARMARLKRSGLPVLGLGEAVERLAAGDLPSAAVVITIDDGWVSTRTHMLPVLERYELPATLYATTWYAQRDLPVVNVAVDYFLAMAAGRGVATPSRAVAIRRIEVLLEGERLDALRALGHALGIDEAWLERRQFHLMQADELADVHARGLSVELHTHRHIDVSTGIGRLEQEVRENRAFIARALGGGEPSHFCYPSGSYHPAAPRVLAETGVRSATLVTEGLNPPSADPYALRRFVDGRGVTQVEFDAYLSGALHYLTALRTFAGGIALEAPRKAMAASSMMLCAL